MNIFLTYDYELFFGDSSGSVDKCLIEPTNRLLELGKIYNVRMTFFVDVGYLIKLDEFIPTFPQLLRDKEKVHAQLREIIDSGNDIQLHIHPHWEKSFYSDGKWHLITDNVYKLQDFSNEDIRRIVTTYKKYIDDLSGKKTTTFRAGGWCVQPFERLYALFKELEIRFDSSVFPGGKFSSSHYAFDFTKAPNKSHYRFETDECVEVEKGYFTEYPISSWRYSPFFYWRLYILGRLFPDQHKMLGDGNFLSQPGRKKSVLSNFTWNHVSTDGYYASKLRNCLDFFVKEGRSDMVIIGHPKSMTNYSFRVLEKFLKENQRQHHFTTFKELV